MLIFILILLPINVFAIPNTKIVEISKNAKRFCLLNLSNRHINVDEIDRLFKTENEIEQNRIKNELVSFHEEYSRLSNYRGEELNLFIDLVRQCEKNFADELYEEGDHFIWTFYFYNFNTDRIEIMQEVCPEPTTFAAPRLPQNSGNSDKNRKDGKNAVWYDEKLRKELIFTENTPDETIELFNDIETVNKNNDKIFIKQLSRHHIIRLSIMNTFYENYISAQKYKYNNCMSTNQIKMTNIKGRNQMRNIIGYLLKIDGNVEAIEELINTNGYENMIQFALLWNPGNIFWGPAFRNDDYKRTIEDKIILDRIVGPEKAKKLKTLHDKIVAHNQKIEELKRITKLKKDAFWKWFLSQPELCEELSNLYFSISSTFASVNSGELGMLGIRLNINDWQLQEQKQKKTGYNIWAVIKASEHSETKDIKNIFTKKNPDDENEDPGACGFTMPSLASCSFERVSKRQVSKKCLSNELSIKLMSNKTNKDLLYCEFANSEGRGVVSFQKYIQIQLQNENTSSKVKHFAQEICKQNGNRFWADKVRRLPSAAVYSINTENNYNEAEKTSLPIYHIKKNNDDMEYWCQSGYIFLNPILLSYCLAAGY